MRAFIYNQLIIPLTSSCYFEVFSRLPQHSLLLDVGIGTGKALFKNKKIIFDKQLKIVGVDINASYLQSCQRLIQEYRLQESIRVKQMSFYDLTDEMYDAIYFSSSFMLLPDQLKALHIAKQHLKPGGKIYFTQTLHTRRSYFQEILKPKLIYLTSIHFGKITYENDFFQLLSQAQLRVLESTTIKKWKSAKEELIVAEPTNLIIHPE